MNTFWQSENYSYFISICTVVITIGRREWGIEREEEEEEDKKDGDKGEEE